MSLGKSDIVKNISTKASLSKSNSQLLLHSFLNKLKNNSSKVIKLNNFGTFMSKKSPKRIGRNPKTKEEFLIDSRIRLVFKASKFIRDKLNK